MLPVAFRLCLFALLASTRPANDDLAAFDKSAVFLVRDRAVQADLRLTPAQAGDVRKITDAADAILWPLRDVPPDKCGDKLRDVIARGRDSLARVLDTRQQERLEQIVLRAQGVDALLRPDVADKLGLTPEQQDWARSLARSIRDARRTLGEAVRLGKRRDEAEGLAARLRRQEHDAVLQALPDAQRRQWLAMLGRTFDTGKLQPPAFKAPEIQPADAWINSEPLTLAKLRGRVVVVHFWTFGCINCIHNYPAYKAWQAAYAGKDLTLIGIHTPETPGERQIDSIRAKAGKNELTFPIAVDNGKKNWDAWSNNVWPSVYLVDRKGYVRYWWYGELGYKGLIGEQLMREKIDELLKESYEP